MELYQLRYFLEVAKQQHVRHSAEKLHVSQPAVTNAIHRMEYELGVPLFLQQGRSIRLSPYGKMLYDELLPLCESLNTLPDRMREYCAFLSQPDIHPLIKSAVAQAYMLVARPFPEGNERLSRMLSSAVLLRCG
ncbi:MAG: LysR family transcriptional regulator, partial [Spirochaetaceae bacterium]|nr:LysR family transcriptional regulator [Spirochaetaceae bacterium]